MIYMTPACNTSCIKSWVCGWSYWLSTSSSMHDHIFFSSCALSFRLLCFGSSNFWKFIFHKVMQRYVLGVVRSLMIVLLQIFQESVSVNELWKSVENWQSYQYELCVPLFWNTVYMPTCVYIYSSGFVGLSVYCAKSLEHTSSCA